MKTITKLIILPILFFTIGLQAQENCFECSDNISKGHKSSAFGYGNVVEGWYSSAFGNANFVSGESSAALGIESRATGKCSFALGWLSESTRNFSTVIGSKSKVNGLHSFVIGYKSEISWGSNGYIFGSNCTLPMGNGFLIGNKLLALTDNAFIIGDGGMDTTLTNDVEHSLVVGFNSNLPTLHVGPSVGPGTTGRIGIGNITAPTAKLHIKADINEDAAIMLQPTGSAYTARIFFGDNNHSIYTKPEADFKFKTSTNNHFVFENGNVGIGTTSSPEAKLQIADGDIFIEDIDRGIIMKSPDGNCWRGTVNNQGQMQFTQVDCDNLALSSPGNENEPNRHIRIYPNPTGNQVTVEIAPEYAGDAA